MHVIKNRTTGNNTPMDMELKPSNGLFNENEFSDPFSSPTHMLIWRMDLIQHN